MEKENVSKKDNSKIVFVIVLVLLLFASVIGITYALFTYGKAGTVNNTVTTGSLTFSYTESSNGIYLENAMPISDEVGKKLDRSGNNNGYFDFNVACKIAGTNRIQYEVYAMKQSTKPEIDDKYVKIYLTDGTTDKPIGGYDVEVPVFSSLKKSISNPKGKQLYFGDFTNSGMQSFRLRMWLSDNYNVTEESEQFKIKVNVQATGN